MNITVYQQDIKNEIIERFIENMLDTNLKFFASELRQFGFGDMQEIEQAVKRAIRVCQATSTPVRSNFRSMYVSDKRTTICDWKLSSLARKLVIINSNASNPFVAKVQIELLNHTS